MAKSAADSIRDLTAQVVALEERELAGLDELERRDLKRGLVTMCAAGGMAPAIIIERI